MLGNHSQFYPTSLRNRFTRHSPAPSIGRPRIIENTRFQTDAPRFRDTD
jgi:hypothetical protein